MTGERTGRGTQGDDENTSLNVFYGGMRMNQWRHRKCLEAMRARVSAFLAMPQQAVASARSALGSRVYTDPIRMAYSKETCTLIVFPVIVA